MNNNQIRVYDNTGSTPVFDPDGLLDRAQDIRFSTVYPGGISDTFSCFIPCDVLGYLPIKHMNMIRARNAQEITWEGYVTNIILTVAAERRGITVEAVGAWQRGNVNYWYNRWIDRRFQSGIYGVWEPYYTTTGAGSNYTCDQNSQILITPKPVNWSNGDTVYIRYNTNASRNVKRVTFDYDFGTTAETNPARAKFYDGSYTSNLTTMIDGNSATSQTISAFNTGRYLYVGIDNPASVTGFRFDLGGTVNANASTLTLEYYGVDAAWHSVAITDGTASGGKTLAQDGTVTFTAIDGWDQVAVNGSQKYFYARFSVSANLTANIVINDVYVSMAQSWTVFLNDLQHSTTLWSTSTAGTGSQDITLGTSSYLLAFGLSSNAQQTPSNSGVYGKITNLACVAESWDGTAKTTVVEIMKDMVYYLGWPVRDYTYIESNTYDMLSTGFVEDDLRNSLAKQMIRLGTFSSSTTAYSVGCLPSSAVPGNYKPVIYYESYPSTTDFDYTIRLDEQQLAGVELVTSANFEDLYNNAFVTFTTPTGKTNWAYSADDPLLADSTSTTTYGTRVKVVQGGQAATAAAAGAFGRPYIAAHKNLQYYMRGPLVVKGTLRAKSGIAIPVSQVRAGKRLRVENFINDVGDISGAGLTFLISRTEYNDDANTVTITASVPDDLAVYLARLQAINSTQL